MPVRTVDGALLMVFVATAGLAFKGIFAKLALATGMTVAGVLLLRIALAAPLFWVTVRVIPYTSAQPPAWRDWRNALLVGNLFTVATIADFTAIDMIGASLSRVMLFTYPLLVQALIAAREQRLPTATEWLSFLLCYSGLALLFAPDAFGGHLTRHDLIGIGCGLVAAASYALYLVLGQNLVSRMGSARFTAATNTSALVAFAVYALGWAGARDFVVPPAGFGWTALMVVFSTVLPFILLFEGIRRTGAGPASLVTLAGPAITLLVAWRVLDEQLSLLQLAGVVLIAAGILVLTRYRPPRRSSSANGRSMSRRE